MLILTFLAIRFSGRLLPFEGLLAQYYSNPNWAGEPLETKIDSSLDFVVPAQKHSSVRWSGWIDVPVTAQYDFGSLYVSIDGTQLLGRPVDLVKGLHQIEVQVQNRNGRATLEIDWPDGWCYAERCLTVAAYPQKPAAFRMVLRHVTFLAGYFPSPFVEILLLVVLLVMFVNDSGFRRYRYEITAGACMFLSVYVACDRIIQYHHGSISEAISIGARYYQRSGLHESVDVLPRLSGFDGQFFYFLAHDPLLKNPRTIRALDSPFLRAKRIFYPILSRSIVWQTDKIPIGMFLVQIASLIGISLLATSLLKNSNLPPWWNFSVALSFSMISSVATLTSETLATLFVLLAFWSYQRNQRITTWMSIAFGILTKEPNAAVLLGIAGSELKERRWRQTILYSMAIVPFVIWYIYLYLHIGTENSGATTQNFGLPFQGVINATSSDLHKISRGQLDRLLPLLCRFWFIAAALASLVWLKRKPNAISIFAALAGFVAVFLASGEEGGLSYDFLQNFARQLYLLPAAIFLLFVQNQNRWLKGLLVACLLLSFYRAITP